MGGLAGSGLACLLCGLGQFPCRLPKIVLPIAYLLFDWLHGLHLFLLGALISNDVRAFGSAYRAGWFL